jgi:hypothetical protein
VPRSRCLRLVGFAELLVRVAAVQSHSASGAALDIGAAVRMFLEAHLDGTAHRLPRDTFAKVSRQPQPVGLRA